MRRFVVSLVATLSVVPMGPAGSAAPRPLLYGGSDCEEAQVVLAAPEERARRFVPDAFELSAEGGLVQVFVGFVACGRIELGKNSGPGMVSEVGIAIDPPDGSGGSHVYSLWQVNDRPDLRKALAKLGMGGGVGDITYWGGLVGPTITAESSVDWGDHSYSLSAAGSAPLTQIGQGHAVWWHSGRKGIVRIQYQLSAVAVGAATGTFETVAGPLADLVGAEVQPAVAPTYRFDFRASARRVKL